MTQQEKKQPNHVFVNAGRKAYRAYIPISGNPYKELPFRDLWDKGWRLERKKEDLKYRPQERPEQRQPRSEAPAPQQRPRLNPRSEKRPVERPVSTDRLINRFNKRYRTVA